MSEQTLFLEGQFAGKMTAPFERVHGEANYPTGLAFFCPLCACVWANTRVMGEGTAVELHPCAEHRNGERLGHSSLGAVSIVQPCGSLLHSWRPGWWAHLPYDLWKRELALTCKWAMETKTMSQDLNESCQVIYTRYLNLI